MDDYGLDAARASLGHYLRALWNCSFTLRACDRPLAQQRPFLSELGIHLPRHYTSHRGTALRALYRAAAAHAAAHLRHSTVRQPRGKLKPVQLAIISLFEDARVEQLAITETPGLRTLWLQFFDPHGTTGNSANALLLRLSHALLDPARVDDNPWVAKAAGLYRQWQRRGGDPQGLREIGSVLGNDLGQMRVQFNPKTYAVEPAYRDDNLFLWQPENEPEETRFDDPGYQPEEDAAQSTERLDDNARQQAALSARETGNGEPADEDSALPRHPEWDHRIGRLRENWCTVHEMAPPQSDPSPLLAQRASSASLSARLAALLQARKLGRLQRMRRQPEGDEFEIDALVQAAADLRSGRAPEPRLFRASRRRKPDLSVLLLLDLSASTEARVGDGTLLALIREASLLLGDAIAQSGDRFAIHGFRSDGRHRIEYLRFKDFDEPMSDAVAARLAGVRGALSTRMGAAIRHASAQLRANRSTQRLILLLTDGEPHDIDVYQPSQLAHDAAHAVRRSAAEGTPVFCISVDAAADGYLKAIFGPHHYRVIDRIEQLPQRLPELYLRLTA